MTNPAPDTERIVITRDEANSQHVDDLLRRQMNLRGETAFAAEPRRRWYYQNWLLFMIVGALAAFVAWLITEPSLNDFLYIQGKIEQVNLDEAMPAAMFNNAGPEAMEFYGQGWVRVNGQRVWLSPGLRQGKDGRFTEPFDPAALQPGTEVGLWAKFAQTQDEDFATAHYIDPKPRAGVSTPALRDQSRASETASFLFFSAVAGLIGLALGAADGIVCRVWSRALLGAVVGALIGVTVGCVAGGVVGSVSTAITTLFAGVLPGAIIGCIAGVATIGTVGTLLGTILVGGPMMLWSAYQYFSTINAPCTTPGAFCTNPAAPPAPAKK